MWIVFLLACTVPAPGPASEGSASRQIAAMLEPVALLAQEADNLGMRIEAICDTNMRDHPLNTSELQRINGYLGRLEQLTTQIDQQLDTVERQVRQGASEGGK